MPSPNVGSLILPQVLLRQIQTECVYGYPEEICGLLLGQGMSDSAHVWALRASPNASLDDRRKSYFMPVEWLFQTQREVRDSSWEVIGVYHSHPDGSASPSDRDIEEAWPGLVYLITPLRDGNAGSTSAWRLASEGHRFDPLPIITQ